MKFTKLRRTLVLFTLGVGLVNGHAQSFLTNGLVAYYPFNGNANDASGNGNNASTHNVVIGADRFGQANCAYVFTNADNYILTPIVTRTNTYTISIWANCHAYGTRGLVGNDDENYSGKSFWLFNGYPQIFNVNPNTQIGTTYTATKPVGLNTWNHVLCSVNAGTVTFYINGISCGTFAGIENYGTNWFIGRKGVSDTQAVFSGSLDDVRIYNRALSASEVAELYAIESGPRVDLIKAVKPSFSHLWLGTNYQMQLSGDMITWTNEGAAFSATNTSMIYPQYWDVENWNSLFFRLQVAP